MEFTTPQALFDLRVRQHRSRNEFSYLRCLARRPAFSDTAVGMPDAQTANETPITVVLNWAATLKRK
ncbi:MAG: hypothetical protein DMG14_25510 [Acidobacteria bacterium]|nr:MAG: hypothetical protein DMG14_25510 [Acidobacteriota bacterium]